MCRMANAYLRLALIVIIISYSVDFYEAFPGGPPIGNAKYPTLCKDMFPSGHNATAQTSASPYEIVLGNTCYKEGQEVQVWVKDKTDTDAEIEGLMIQARTKGTPVENPAIQGTFSKIFEADPIGAYSCLGGENNTLGHKDAEIEAHKVTFTWTAPASGTDDIEFVATIVQHEPTFWMMVKSDVLSYNSSCKAVDIDDTPVSVASHHLSIALAVAIMPVIAILMG